MKQIPCFKICIVETWGIFHVNITTIQWSYLKKLLIIPSDQILRQYSSFSDSFLNVFFFLQNVWRLQIRGKDKFSIRYTFKIKWVSYSQTNGFVCLHIILWHKTNLLLWVLSVLNSPKNLFQLCSMISHVKSTLNYVLWCFKICSNSSLLYIL